MESHTNESTAPSIDLCIDEVRRQYDFEFSRFTWIETKAGILLGAEALIWSLVATILYPDILCPFVLYSILMSISFIFIIKSIWPRDFRRVDPLNGKEIHMPQEIATKLRIKAYVIASNANRKSNKKKMKVIKYGIYSFVLALIILIISLVSWLICCA